MKGIVVDDEPIAHEIISDYCKKSDDIQIVGCFQNPVEAISFLNNNSVDLIFLDINMPELNGIEFSKALIHPYKIIVTTAHEDFALESFNFGAIDYLLKPFSFSRFLKAVGKAKQYQPSGITSKTNTNETIHIRANRKHILIKSSSIVYIKSYGNYCKVITESEILITRETLTHFISILSNQEFIQIHKSFIVNKHFVRSVNQANVALTTINLTIGKSYRENVMLSFNF